jgi:hypothetical protein
METNFYISFSKFLTNIRVAKKIKNKIIFVLLLLVMFCVILFALLGKHMKVSFTPTSFAKQIVAICKNKNHSNLCYEKEIPKLMDKPYSLSMENAFQVARQVQIADTSYNFCHVLGHKLSAKETKKDPTLWQQVIGRCPQGVCSNGCIHGAFQERFRTELNRFLTSFLFNMLLIQKN